MHGTSLRDQVRVNKVKRRLVFEEDDVSTVHTTKALRKDDSSEQHTPSMAQAHIEKVNSEVSVFFLGYRHPHWSRQQFWCADCIDQALGYTINTNDDHLYISSGEKPLSQFTDKDHQDKSNYCATCEVPLYDIVNEQCRQFNPTSNKWRQRFLNKRQYGLRGGGTSQSTK